MKKEIEKNTEFYQNDDSKYKITTYQQKENYNNREWKGVWIPKELWTNWSLTWMEKLFLIEIDSLDNDEGCFASNNYFAKFFNLSKGRCSQIIGSLLKKNLIKIDYEYEGKMIIKRIIRVFNILKGGIKYIKGGYLENDKENNIKNNNINTNILSKDNKRSSKTTPNKYDSLKERETKNKSSKKKHYLSYDNTSNFTKRMMKILLNKILIIHPKLHKDKYYSEKELYWSEKYINYFVKRFPKNNFSKLRNFVENSDNIPISILEEGFGKEKFEQEFIRAVKVYDYDCQPNDKNQLPSRFSDFLIRYTGFSWFLHAIYNGVKNIEVEKADKHPLITDKYMKEFLKVGNLDIKNKNVLIKYVSAIVEEHRDICTNKIRINKVSYCRYQYENSNFHMQVGEEGNALPFIENHIHWLNLQAKNNDRFIPDVKHLKMDGYWWNLFEKWFEKTHDIVFFPNEDWLEWKCEEYVKIAN